MYIYIYMRVCVWICDIDFHNVSPYSIFLDFTFSSFFFWFFSSIIINPGVAWKYAEEKRQIPDCDVEKIPEESENNAESAPHSYRKVHPHEGYKAKPYGIVTEQMRRQTDRMKDRTKPGMSLKSSKSSTVGTAFRCAAPGGRQSQEAPNARGASRKPLVQSAPKGPNGPQTPKRKETSNAGKDQQPQDSKIQVPTEEHKVQPDQTSPTTKAATKV